MQTVARPSIESAACHWYDPKTAEPRHFIERSDGNGTRPTTLRDAKKFGWVPSPTSILKCLDKPALNAWKTEIACLAVLTTPRKPGEELDAFVERVLHTERQQDEQAQKARDLGIQIHDAIEQCLNKRADCPKELQPFVFPAVEEMQRFGTVLSTERVVVGDRCAGRLDAHFQNPTTGQQTVVDVKTTSNPPQKGSWFEHRLQLSFYAKALPLALTDQTANVYISTKEPGIVVVDTHSDWPETYQRGFKPLLDFWCYSHDYVP